MKSKTIIEDAVPVNAAGAGATIAGLDSNPPVKKKRLLTFKMFVRNKLQK